MEINSASILFKREERKTERHSFTATEKRAIDSTCLEVITIFILFYAIIYLFLSPCSLAPFDRPDF